MGDNGFVPIVPRTLVDQQQVEATVANLERALKPDVVRIRYAIGEDWAGDPAIHFRILLSDEASEPERLSKVANRVRKRIKQVDPFNAWGLLPYINFRSESEQATLKDAIWA
jgi:hypothetical protein